MSALIHPQKEVREGVCARMERPTQASAVRVS